MKYVIVKDQYGTEQPIVSSEIMGHADLADNCNVVSAGFCRFNVGGEYNDEVVASVWGESITLKKKSRPEDAALLELMLRY